MPVTRSGNWDNSFDGDFRVADGWELVSLLRQNSGGTFDAAVTPIFAVREAVDKRKVAGQMEAADVIFHLDASDGDAPDGTATVGVGSTGVRPGDQIQDAVGRNYGISGATLEGAEDQWRCPCVKVPT